MSTETIQTFSEPEVLPPAPPAYFLSLTVENFRCFGPAQTLDLSDGEGHPAPWTIILGENGVGKTTLLQCLSIARVEAMPETDELTNSALYCLNFSDVKAYELLKSFGPRNGENAATLKFSFCIGSSLLSGMGNAERTDFNLVIFPKGRNSSIIDADARGLICYGYGASRRMGKSTLSEQHTEDATASLFSDGVNLINAEEWLLQADYAAVKSQGGSKVALRRDQVKQILTDLLPDVKDLRIKAPNGKLGVAVVEFQTPYGWVPLKSLSLGYQTLITWMVDLASRLFDRYPDSPNPLAEPAVVLVDEIDLHLHPRWQRTLMGFLSEKFPNAQFIATAHSPLVVQAATDANIVLLRREGDHVVIDNNVETIKNWRVDQILTSDLFGLESARPPQLDGALAERTRILSKPSLSKADERRLTALEAQIGQMPTGETSEDMQAMDIIRRAAQLLKTE